MRLSIVVPSISRSGGGFFHSVRNLAKQIQTVPDIDLKVLTSENDCPDDDIEAWKPVEPVLCRSYGPYSFRFSPTLLRMLERNQPDLVHQHGIWQHPSLVMKQWRKKTGKPTMISPRGMLDPWARSRSSYKKKFVECWFERHNLRNASCIHSLCEAETLSAREYGLTQSICEIPNGVELPPYPDFDARRSRTEKSILFLSRIHPKKGLVELVQGWIDFQSRTSCQEKRRLLIVGWDEIGFLESLIQECKQAGFAYDHFADSGIAEQELRKNDSKRSSLWFVNGAFGETKHKLLSAVDAYILPSYSEGLPVSVLEAWAYGLPTIISSECNLPIGFEQKIAIPVEHSRVSVSDSMELLFSAPIERHIEIGKLARKIVEQRFTWSVVAEEMINVYRWLIDCTQPQPASIRRI